MSFVDRVDAGRRLGERLSARGVVGRDVVVLGLPRGGVPVAFEVARALGAPLDVLVVRKLGAPSQPELAMGAIGEGGVRVLNDDVVAGLRVRSDDLAAAEDRERAILVRRVARFRSGRPPVSLTGRTAVIVDDGIATGSTARAACRIARARGATRVVLAVPVAPTRQIPGLDRDADEVICLETPSPFFAVGQFYADFSEVSDEEVSALLDAAMDEEHRRTAAAHRDEATTRGGGRSGARDDDVEIPAGPVTLAGHLSVPEGADALVVFVHGSGSSRFSPRNRFVSGILTRAGLGTLLFDLLTPEEERDRGAVFDIELLATRLVAVTAWLRSQPGSSRMRIGYFGASTGAAAALWAAAEPDSVVTAVVSRGGRPDLATERLAAVRAATQLIVGGDDDVVLELNRRAAAKLRCESRLVVVPGATHLFEEPGTLQTAGEAARDWFLAHLAGEPTPS